MNKTHQPAGQMQLSMELFFLVLKILEQKESSFFSSFSIVATQLKLTKWVPNEEKKSLYCQKNCSCGTLNYRRKLVYFLLTLCHESFRKPLQILFFFFFIEEFESRTNLFLNKWCKHIYIYIYSWVSLFFSAFSDFKTF